MPKYIKVCFTFPGKELKIKIPKTGTNQGYQPAEMEFLSTQKGIKRHTSEHFDARKIKWQKM